MKRFAVSGNYHQYTYLYWDCELDGRYSKSALTKIDKLKVGETYTIKDKGFETIIERVEDD